MWQQPTKEIEDIPYPQKHMEDLKRLNPLMISSMERDGPPIESGSINVGYLDKNLDVALFLFRWVVENNEVIENLNLVLNDFKTLPTNYVLLTGSPKTRYYLLVRTYFNEFYRFREIHNRTVKAAASRGYIESSNVAFVRKAFHEAFESAIDLRNNLVHCSTFWKGKKHFDLNLIVAARELGFGIKSIESGEMWEVREVLEDICSDTVNMMRDEAIRMSSLLKRILQDYVDIVAKV
ncbi:putative nucleotidyltransferase [Rheinheimera pacifica]|uniref:hypothetical protein n=1 Tax=Rheinheimera pacifica TaxID=173990 RepID=UPI002169108E|nr:hypothetical protein [Rheinheimera pacifica]MCS4307811.1 putative nucleotidyltransferase [Rheinheimera pacifica]